MFSFTCLASLLQLVHLPLVELELAGLRLRQVGQVERHSDEVALRGVVTFIIIVINDHVITVVFRRSHILEVVKIERVGEDVVRVDTLQGLAHRLLFAHHSVVLILSQESHVESTATVHLLTLTPLAVFIVETGPVVVNIFIQIDVTNSKGWEHAFDLFADPGATDFEHDEEEDGEHHGPEEASPTLSIEHNEHLMIALEDVGHGGPRRQMIIRQELLAGSHPVAEEEHQNGRILQSVQHILTQTLVVHGRHTVSIVEHQLLLEVENDHGKTGNREQDWHAQAVHESDEDDVEEGGVLVVHEVFRARIHVQIRLDRGLLSLILVAAASLIHQPE